MESKYDMSLRENRTVLGRTMSVILESGGAIAAGCG